MNLAELAVLLPCHSLEDFPQYYEGDAADGLLAAWCALWHPALLAAAGQVPAWHRVDLPPADLQGRVLVVPPACRDQLPGEIAEQARSQSAAFVDDCTSRPELVARLLNQTKLGGGPEEALSADFMALGYCRLQVELLMRQMRYSSHIDELQLNAEVVAAAKAATEDDQDAARVHLANAFELLYEARKYYYPVDAYLIDLTLVSDTTLGKNLARELNAATATNLLMTADLVSEVARREPESFQALRQALGNRTSCLIGGECSNGRLPLMPLEAVYENFARGLRKYEDLVGTRPLVFGRQRYGLTPILPGILSKFGFVGAVHFTLDDGQFPLGAQAKIRWEGNDASAVDALGRLARDAARPETFLGFSRRIGDSMDSDHVATVCFAHWPGHWSGWYDDLRRIAELSPVLGKFVTLDEYFNNTESAGRLSKFKADEYRAPYLRQAVEAGASDPISGLVAQYRAQDRRDTVSTLHAMREMIAGAATGQTSAGNPEPGQSLGNGAEASLGADDGLETAATALAGAIASPLDGGIEELLVINPLSFTRRLAIDPQQLSPGEGTSHDVSDVEVSSMGFAWVPTGTAHGSRKRSKPLASDNALRNQHMEVLISRETGGIEAIHAYQMRGNRLSQQLALRLSGARADQGHLWRDPDQDAVYSTMRAESVEVSRDEPHVGEITSRGVLIDESGNTVCRYRQRFALEHSSQTLKLEIELEPQQMPQADPWLSYYASRIAWSDTAATVSRNVGFGLESTEAKRIEAPHVVQVSSGRARTSILTGGLAYHRRAGARMLDTLLIVEGETARKFTVGIGIDLVNPLAGAISFFSPPIMVRARRAKAQANSGWLMHVDARNVLATHWSPLPTHADPAAEGETGFRVRLAETAGQAGRVTLRAFRSVRDARLVDFQGQTLLDLAVEDDKIPFDIAAYEWVELEARWA